MLGKSVPSMKCLPSVRGETRTQCQALYWILRTERFLARDLGQDVFSLSIWLFTTSRATFKILSKPRKGQYLPPPRITLAQELTIVVKTGS